MISKLRNLLMPLAALVWLAGCVTPPIPVTERISPATHEAVLNYRFQPCSPEIAAAEQARIRKFLDSLGLTSQDILVVSVPKHRLPQRDIERRQTLERIFAGYPAQVRFVQDRNFRELTQSEPTGIIRAVRVHDVTVDCPTGSHEPGCTTAQNLAAMIAHPADTFWPQKGAAYQPVPKTAPPTTAGVAP
ncbi:hypothetical protein Q9295_03125 [Xinfangfangia sp. CPCC 101601]|uniref:Pilus assembly protein CpaD n=1 Tax=Pseudogemmobacter lacusdianii TaxID=3069608 RepID=A0ABU0VUE9_9RHOB|nr:hypothetical protein [Xinfangfangia sp. CPCC 101601]MDQ2065354.1 hypothetical protein [Xinfangfangia sp. CPCC 101601]